MGISVRRFRARGATGAGASRAVRAAFREMAVVVAEEGAARMEDGALVVVIALTALEVRAADDEAVTVRGSYPCTAERALVIDGRGADVPEGTIDWSMPILLTLSVMVYEAGTTFRSAHWNSYVEHAVKVGTATITKLGAAVTDATALDTTAALDRTAVFVVTTVAMLVEGRGAAVEVD